MDDATQSQDQQPSAGADVGGGALKGASAGMAFGPWGALIGAGAGAIYGGYQYNKAKNALDTISKTPYPNFTLTDAMKNASSRAEQMAQQGFSPQEIAAFKQNVAQQQNTGYRQAVNMGGGNLAQALSNGFAAQKLNSLNQFAGQDAELHRANIHYADSLTKSIQSQGNIITEGSQARRNALERAYGGAMKAGSENVLNGINNGVGLGMQAAGGNNGYPANYSYGNRGLSGYSGNSNPTNYNFTPDGANNFNSQG